MSRKRYFGCPRCRKATCFANEKGFCTILSSSKFKGDCPFYKEPWEKHISDMKSEQRLNILDEQRRLNKALEKAKRYEDELNGYDR